MRFIVVLSLFLFVSAPVVAEEFLYPKKNQSSEQQEKDKYECFQCI